jgi:hypothetical protein
MLIIEEKVIDPAIFEQEFVCNLDACQGACCWEGDFGAPLETAEIEILNNIYQQVKPFLQKPGINAIEKQGVAVYIPQEKEYGTPLIENAACAYLRIEANGMAKCGLEKAYEAGAIDFKKPISCHLYPIRVENLSNSSFSKLDYDEWEICSAACSKGKALQVPVYQFLKEPLIRKYGASFYEQMEQMAQYLDS